MTPLVVHTWNRSSMLLSRSRRHSWSSRHAGLLQCEGVSNKCAHERKALQDWIPREGKGTGQGMYGMRTP